MVKKSANQSGQLSPENYIRKKSRNLQIKECFINKGWKEGKLCNIIIIRQHSNGNVTYCVYMVDLNCLGVKDSFYQFNVPYAMVQDFFNESGKEHNLSIIKIPYKLAHNIIHAGIEYAEEYGFKPCKVFTSVTGYFLEEDTDAIPLIQIECGGKDGKPLYVNNGFESAFHEKQILAQLEKTAGEGNYHFIRAIHDDDEPLYEETDATDEEPEINEEFSKYQKELEALSKEDQKKMFLRLVINQEKIDDADSDRLYILSILLTKDIIEDAEVENHLKRFEETFDINFVEFEVLPNTLLLDINSKDIEKVSALLTNTLAAIDLDSKPKKAIAYFREIMGDIPVSNFLEMFYLQIKNSKDAIKKMKECYQKFPDYLMFQVYYYFELLHERKKVDPVFFENLLRDKQLDVTEFEGDIYFYFYTFILLADDNTGISELMAYINFVKSLDFIKKRTFRYIFTYLNIGIRQKVYDYLQLNGSENKGKTYIY